jgi:hypothetical protein
MFRKRFEPTEKPVLERFSVLLKTMLAKIALGQIA